jgi:hypothetical protein
LAELGTEGAVAELLSKAGIARTDWSTAFFAVDELAKAPARYAYFDGIFEMKQLVLYDLLRRLKTAYPELDPIAAMSGYYEDDSDGTATRKQTMIHAINGLGGVPEAGSGKGCAVLGRALSQDD